MENDPQKIWAAYVAGSLAEVTPILSALGYVLESNQPHSMGERYLMQAVTTTHGRKLILLGTHTATATRVVIKTSNEKEGVHELKKERAARELLQKIKFAYTAFVSPKELFFGKRSGYLFSIQEYVEQEHSFLERPLAEQFELSLRALKAQEGARATTYRHVKVVEKTFGRFTANEYLQHFQLFAKGIRRGDSLLENEKKLLDTVLQKLQEGASRIDQYGGFLTHTDFVPHNFRVAGNTLYLLDYSSLRFGNKYEGWARFLNFMELYNPELCAALITYVKNNRTLEELETLTLMRLYRLAEIALYYTNAAQKSTGNLSVLNTARVHFWLSMMQSVLGGVPLLSETRTSYQKLRDNLRSSDEKTRQIGLH